MKVRSYSRGEWIERGRETELLGPVTGKPVATLVEADLDYEAMCRYARQTGGPELRAMTIHERAFRIKFLAKYLLARKEKYYELSTLTGATRKDSWIDIEGGIITAFGISSKARRELSDLPYHVEGSQERLSRKGSFTGQHICVPRRGLAVHINAFNFPVWGLLEKLAPTIIAGMPALIKPSPTGSWLAQAVFEDILESGFLPGGAVQFLAADKPGDLFDHLISQDVVAFTGSATTGRLLKSHPNILANNIRFNLESDSLNCSVLGSDITPDMEEFELFVNEVAEEMTVKAGQKCTAIRRTIVPAVRTDEVIEALRKRLEQTRVGDPADEQTQMGPLAGTLQAGRYGEQIRRLDEVTETVYGNGLDEGAFTGARVLLCRQPMQVEQVHTLEAFGPLTTVLPYTSVDEAIALANKSDGSLVGSLFTFDDELARTVTLGCAPYHGRFMVINRHSAKESTGHGSPIASLVHGGPGRAGGGEELGGARSVLHYMQRVALQGAPTTLMKITGQHIRGADTEVSQIHPFRKYFEELSVGEHLITHRRTVTEADIVNFGALSGDHFYAHFDETAAKESLFGKRVAHGYLVLSAAAGLFVDPAPGPVLLNYGLDELRFLAPVAPGDTIQAKLSVKRKTARQKRKTDPKPFGMVWWDVEVRNQEEVLVAGFTVLTHVERKHSLWMDE